MKTADKLARDLLEKERISMGAGRGAELIDFAVLRGGDQPDMLFITYALSPIEVAGERALAETRYAAARVGDDNPMTSGIVGTTWEESK